MKMIAATSSAFAVFAGSLTNVATLEVHPQKALFDQPVTISMNGVTPDEKVLSGSVP